MDRDKLTKVIALIGSDIDGEALAAFRMAKGMLEGEGLLFRDVLEAGLDALSASDTQAGAGQSDLKRHDEIFEHIKEASERRRSRRPARRSQPVQPKDGVTRIIGVQEIPDAPFEAMLQFVGQSITNTGALMLIIKAAMVSGDGRLQLPSLAVNGKLALTLEEVFRLETAPEIEARIKVRKPFQPGSMPSLVSAVFC